VTFVLVACAGRGVAEEAIDYSLLIAFFAGGLTAICILVVGVTLTLYRRNHPARALKAQLAEPPTRYECKEERSASSAAVSTNDTQHRDELKQQTSQPAELPDDDPDVIPSKVVDRRPDIFEPASYASGRPSERTKDYRCHEELEYPSPSSILHAKDTWIYPNGYAEKGEKGLSPIRPSTLPVHRTHDIYTRSSRVQESCI